MSRYLPLNSVAHVTLAAHSGDMQSALRGRMTWGEFDRKERRKAERAAKKRAAKQARMMGEGK